MSERLKKIEKILHKTYSVGAKPSPMVAALAKDVDKNWDSIKAQSEKYFGRNFHSLLTNHIWMWYGGGGTAEAAALEIIEALGVDTTTGRPLD